MTFTVSVFACFCAFFFYSWRNVTQAKKHDDVLFPFCQLRRDINRFRYENVLDGARAISREEYASVRGLLKVVDVTIRNYNRHKTAMFNLRKVEKHLRAYRRSAKPAPALPDNPRILEFHQRFRALLVKAFIAYTPLIRWELALRMIAFANQLGKEGSARRARYVLTNAPKVRADWRNYAAGELAAI